MSEKRCKECEKWVQISTSRKRIYCDMVRVGEDLAMVPLDTRPTKSRERIGICKDATLMLFPEYTATTEGCSCDELDRWLRERGL